MPNLKRSPRSLAPRRFAAHRVRLHRGVASMRRGFTLVELMLVMAVLVVIAAFAIPAIKGPLDNYRLRKSADKIRSAFASARAAAARTGMTHVFQYKPETGEYTIEPWTTGDEFIEMNSLPTMNTGGAAPIASAPLVSPLKTEPLPTGVVFHGVLTETSLRDLRTISGAGDSASAIATASSTAAPPILFYADGTSSNATVVLKNGRGVYVQIKLRGLTGQSSASKLLSGDKISGS